MQHINVQLAIPIPDDCILIKKVEWEEMKKSELEGVYWSMQDLESRVSRKQVWIKENILYPPRFKKILDIENGGFVFYPKAKGQNWSFQASRMTVFLEKNFSEIFKGTK
jgi:phage pi2 protein 07